MMTMGKCELFQKLQQEDTGFIWKPTWKGNKKTIAYYKLKKKKKKIRPMQQLQKLIV